MDEHEMWYGTDILFFSRDPGGANALIPIYLKLKDLYKVKVFGKDYAKRIWRNAGIDCIDLTDFVGPVDKRAINQFLSEIEPKIVITGTSFDDKTELMIWEACRSKGIHSFAYVDSWINYKARFSDFPDLRMINDADSVKFTYPSKILCVDTLAKADMILDGIPEEKIIVGGYWHLSHAKETLMSVKENTIEKYRNNVLGNNSETNKKKLLLFISEPISQLYKDIDTGFSYGFDEKSIFSLLSNSLGKIPNINDRYVLVVRPHPKEKVALWKERICKIEMPIIIDNTSAIECQLRSADLVLGMMSQCLNEAACIGKCIISVQIGRRVNEPLFISRKGIIKTILNELDLEKSLMDYFEGFISPVRFDPFDNQCRNTIKLIEEVVKHA